MARPVRIGPRGIRIKGLRGADRPARCSGSTRTARPGRCGGSSGCAPSGPYVREAIEKNQTEGALDRLHTFVIKFLRRAHGVADQGAEGVKDNGSYGLYVYIYLPIYLHTYSNSSRSNSTPATSGSPLGQRLGGWWSLMTCTSVSSLTTATSAACKAACLLARSDRFWGRMFKSVGRYIYTYRVTGPGMHPAGRGPAAALPIGMYIHR